MKALIVVDVQRDFCPGGALPAQQGDQVVPVINRLMPRFELVVATQDWHPPGHRSFAANHSGRSPGDVIELEGLEQILWPAHCVQGSPGADFHPQLDLRPVAAIIRKGTDPRIDSYSGFFDNGHRRTTGLGDYLRGLGAEELFVCGLATDYCVKFTALDAVDLGFKVCLVEDAVRPVNAQRGDADRAIDQMRARGVEVAASSALRGGSA